MKNATANDVEPGDVWECEADGEQVRVEAAVRGVYDLHGVRIVRESDAGGPAVGDYARRMIWWPDWTLIERHTVAA